MVSPFCCKFTTRQKESNLIQFELKKHVQVRTATSYPGSSPTVVFKSEGMLIFRAEKMSWVQYLWSEIIFFFYKFSISGFTLNWYYSNVLYHQRIKLLAFHISPFLKINDNLIFPAKLELWLFGRFSIIFFLFISPIQYCLFIYLHGLI